LKDASESAAVTMFGGVLVVRKARPEKVVLWNSTDISGTVEECRVHPQMHAVMRQTAECRRAADPECHANMCT